MERPDIHVCVEISKIGIFGHGFEEWFPSQADGKPVYQCGFSNPDIPGNGNKLFHLSSEFFRAEQSSTKALPVRSAMDSNYFGISPASSLSITCLKTSSGCAPTMASPLIKNVGVELTPRLMAKSLSVSIFF